MEGPEYETCHECGASVQVGLDCTPCYVEGPPTVWAGPNEPRRAKVRDLWVDDAGPRNAVIRVRVSDGGWDRIGKVRIGSHAHHLIRRVGKDANRETGR